MSIKINVTSPGPGPDSFRQAAMLLLRIADSVTPWSQLEIDLRDFGVSSKPATATINGDGAPTVVLNGWKVTVTYSSPQTINVNPIDLALTYATDVSAS